jgi:methylated-DNA-[protein]-cysteine S-methyltransferase
MQMLAETQAPMRYCFFDTAFGSVGIAWSDRGVTRLQLPEANRQASERRLCRETACAIPDSPPPPVDRVIRALQCYLAGERVDFSATRLDLTGVGTFHCGIYDAARRVRWGETTTYGELARRAGSPDAARAVGQAMGRNPVPIIIPCHRVLASGGKPGGFSAHGGVNTKQRLLALEGVGLRPSTPLLPGLLCNPG